MGAVEDTRKILQDFLAPELREIKVRLDVVEKRVDGVDRKIDKLDEKIDRVSESLNSKIDMVGGTLNAKIEKLNEKIDRLEDKFDIMDRRSEQRHDSLMMQLGRMSNESEILERLARLEGQRSAQ
jgi:peptidoglycan hydrolase CwlO-like protein